MNKKIISISAGIIVIGVGIVWGVSWNKNGQVEQVNTQKTMEKQDIRTQPANTNQTIPTQTAGEGQQPAASRTKEFTISGQNFSFAPSSISVKKGDTVKIIFKNTNGFHDLKIDAFKAATKKIQGGSEETIQFIADKTGTFEYYCSVGSHRAMGMKGALTVE